MFRNDNNSVFWAYEKDNKRFFSTLIHINSIYRSYVFLMSVELKMYLPKTSDNSDPTGVLQTHPNAFSDETISISYAHLAPHAVHLSACIWKSILFLFVRFSNHVSGMLVDLHASQILISSIFSHSFWVVVIFVCVCACVVKTSFERKLEIWMAFSPLLHFLLFNVVPYLFIFFCFFVLVAGDVHVVPLMRWWWKRKLTCTQLHRHIHALKTNSLWIILNNINMHCIHCVCCCCCRRHRKSISTRVSFLL